MSGLANCVDTRAISNLTSQTTTTTTTAYQPSAPWQHGPRSDEDGTADHRDLDDDGDGHPKRKRTRRHHGIEISIGTAS